VAEAMSYLMLDVLLDNTVTKFSIVCF